MPLEPGFRDDFLADFWGALSGLKIRVFLISIKDVFVFFVVFQECFYEHVGIPAFPGFVSNGLTDVYGYAHQGRSYEDGGRITEPPLKIAFFV